MTKSEMDAVRRIVREEIASALRALWDAEALDMTDSSLYCLIKGFKEGDYAE